MNRYDFPFNRAANFAGALIETIYGSSDVHPGSEPDLSPLPVKGEGIDGLESALSYMVQGSTGLASPMMAGHMDTSPHPGAAFADAVVSALNNNLLFRELSPFASRVEELLLIEFAQALGLADDWHGTFVSGGTLANLTALFAATGGYAAVGLRASCELFVSRCAHASILKSAAILGIPESRIQVIDSDEEGRADPMALASALEASSSLKKIVIAVLGSTVHGAIENVAALSKVAREAGAWLHVDAIYGGALAYSSVNRHWLTDLNLADSVVIGPQKWMYVPRLSAVIWVKGESKFHETLRWAQSYSGGAGNHADNQLGHRGQWGIQGSRRADALTLWAVLRCIGTAEIGHQVDRAIELTKTFYDLLNEDDQLRPTHQPDLNLLCFEYRDSVPADLTSMHNKMGKNGSPWVSLSQWGKRSVFRSVLLAPECTEKHLHQLIATLRIG